MASFTRAALPMPTGTSHQLYAGLHLTTAHLEDWETFQCALEISAELRGDHTASGSKERNSWSRAQRPPAGPQTPTEQTPPECEDSRGPCVCVVTRALVASGYEWDDLEDTRATLLFQTSEPGMKGSPGAAGGAVHETEDISAS